MRRGSARFATWYAVVGALLLGPSVARAQAVPEARTLIEASDAIRNPGEAFRLNTELFEYREGKLRNQLRLTVYARPEQGGGYANLLRFDVPARDAGKLMLFQGRDLWFYDPASRASFRISPQQRLIGQAANGDVVNVSLSHDYAATLVGEEEVVDGDRNSRRAHRLRLTAATATATYSAIDYWQDRDDARPIKARFFSDSGQLLKTAFHRKYARWLGRDRATEVVIIDGLNSQWVTVLQYSNFEARDVPESWMQRDFLPRFRE